MQWIKFSAAVAIMFAATTNANAGMFDCFKGEPSCCAPAPKCCHIEPSCCAPAPKCCHVEPSCCAPAPTCCHVEPSCCAPAPTCCNVEPSCCCPQEQSCLSKLWDCEKRKNRRIMGMMGW